MSQTIDSTACYWDCENNETTGVLKTMKRERYSVFGDDVTRTLTTCDDFKVTDA